MRRNEGNMNGERFCANINKKEVHDLDNEKKICQIGEIITAKHDRPYTSLAMAHNDGYDNCAYCIGGSRH